MSVIIAGKKCSSCGTENYWSSFGHPKWYKEEDQEKIKLFKQLLSKNMCFNCLLDDDSNLETLVELFGHIFLKALKEEGLI